MADALLEAAGSEETGDRELPDEDQHLGLHDAKLAVEPMGAVGDCSRLRRQVPVSGAVATGKAAHQRGDISQAPERFGAFETGSHHPAVELFPGTTGKRTARLPLNRTRRLPYQEEGCTPRPRERRGRLRDDALVDADVAGTARGLEGLQLNAT